MRHVGSHRERYEHGHEHGRGNRYPDAVLPEHRDLFLYVTRLSVVGLLPSELVFAQDHRTQFCPAGGGLDDG